MIWNFVIIGAVVIIFIILARKLPMAYNMKEKEEPEISKADLNKFSIIIQAQDAFENQEYEKAEELYIKAVTQDPGNAKIYESLGEIYLEKKNYYDAKEAFLQSIKLENGVASRYNGLGLTYMGFKDYFKASQSFQRAIEFSPHDKIYRVAYEKAQKAYEKEKKRKK